MFMQDRKQMRDYFFKVWEKHQQQSPLEPLEAIIAQVIVAHPEYHADLAAREKTLQRNFEAESNRPNPFLHMGMHIALKEQIAANRPFGIAVLFKQLLAKLNTIHAAEHQMIACLEKSLWEAQHHHHLPDEARYLECLKKMI